MAHLWLIYGSFMAHSWLNRGSTMAQFMAHLWNNHGSFMAHSWLNSWLIYGTIMAHSWLIHIKRFLTCSDSKNYINGGWILVDWWLMGGWLEFEWANTVQTWCQHGANTVPNTVPNTVQTRFKHGANTVTIKKQVRSKLNWVISSLKYFYYGTSGI